MPVYEALCKECELLYEYVAKIADCMKTPRCSSCGEKTHKVIFHAPMGFVKGKFEPFKSQVDGSIITTQRDLTAHNARNNVCNLHDIYDERTIFTGDIAPKQIVPDKKEIAQDMLAAIHEVSNGYKPNIGAQDDD